MPETTRLRKPALIAGLLLLAAGGAANATTCQTGHSSLLYQSLPSDFSEHGCYVEHSNPDPKPHESNDDWKHFTWYDFNGHQWNGWHNHRYYKDGKDCTPSVVPLPASSWLLMSGALALLALGRRRRQATA